MKRQTICIVLVMLSLLAFAALAVSAQDVDNLKFPKLGKIDMPKIERVTLDNGLRIYLVEDRELPVFSMSVRINCGSYLEPADKVGLADVCGMVMRTGGTQKWSGDEIDELLEAVGGTVETGIGLTSANAYVNMLGEYTDLGIEVLADILRQPIFDEDKIDLAKVQLRSVISRRNDDPQGILGREFDKLIYGPESVYARHSEYKTINAVTRDDLIAFHSTYFKPENVQMSIWGDFSNKEMVTKIKAYFADWERGSTVVPPLPEVDYQFDGNVHFADKTDVNQSNIFIGHIGGLTTDEDYADRIVMNNIIGGGFSSRMFSRVRSKEGLAYGTYGVYTSHIKYPGVFYNYAGTKSETTGKAIREVIKVIKSMHDEPPTDDEMRTAKESFLNSFVFRFDTKSEVVNRMMNYEFFDLPEDFLHQLKDKIEKVTAEDVVAASKKHLHPDKLQVLVVGKVADFEVPLEELGLGPVTEIDITIPSGEEERELAITPENLAKGKEILDQVVIAHGGLENFKNAKSTSTKGTMTFVTPQGEFPITFEEVFILPNKRSQIASVFGQKIYDIQDGSTGWKTDQRTMAVVAKTEDDNIGDLKQLARNNIVVFQQADDPAFQVVFDGEGTVNDVAVSFIALIDSEGELMCRYGIDTDSHQLVCKYATQETPMGEGTVEQIFGDFMEVSGLIIPMTSVRSLNNQKIGELKYSEFLINAEIPADAFAKPE